MDKILSLRFAYSHATNDQFYFSVVFQNSRISRHKGPVLRLDNDDNVIASYKYPEINEDDENIYIRGIEEGLDNSMYLTNNRILLSILTKLASIDQNILTLDI